MATQLGVMYRREQDPSGLIQAAQRAEELGFDQFWIVEDCFYMGGISQASIALSATTSIKVGIGINPTVAHNAAILAMEYSTLERAFPGRLIGGLGHGVDIWMQQIGEKVASPLTAMEETTTAMKRLLQGERITVDGRYVKLTDVALDPPPAQAPPILHGVRAIKSMQLAGRVADGVLLAENAGPEYIRWSREQFYTDRKEPGHIAVYAHALVDDDDPDGAFEKMRRVVANANQAGLSAATNVLRYANEMQKLVDEGGEEALFQKMPDEWVHDLSIAGSVEEGQASIDRMVAAGAESVIFTPMPEWNWMEWMEKVSALLPQQA